MTMPYQKYTHYPTVALPDRTWPDRVIEHRQLATGARGFAAG